MRTWLLPPDVPPTASASPRHIYGISEDLWAKIRSSARQHRAKPTPPPYTLPPLSVPGSLCRIYAHRQCSGRRRKRNPLSLRKTPSRTQWRVRRVPPKEIRRGLRTYGLPRPKREQTLSPFYPYSYIRPTHSDTLSVLRLRGSVCLCLWKRRSPTLNKGSPYENIPIVRQSVFP